MTKTQVQSEVSFVLSLDSPDAMLETAGGKGANLSRMTRAGFPVPPGFLITTAAYRVFVQANDLQAQIVALATNTAKTLEETSLAIRRLFEQGCVPPEAAAAIQSAYAQLTRGNADVSPVAVRSRRQRKICPMPVSPGSKKVISICAVRRHCWTP